MTVAALGAGRWGWLHASGGLVYHARAWRYRRLWAPFHATLRAWLEAWHPARDSLLLIGPSGGYALDAAFLARFACVTVIEPDPLARWLLRRRFPRCDLVFAPDPGLAQPDGFARLAREFPGAAILFCNLLGQPLVGEARGMDRDRWIAGLPHALARHSWASWHDRVSTARAPDRAVDFSLPAAEPLETLVARVWQGGEIELVDHLPRDLAPDLARRYALWTLRPDWHHLVEWMASPGTQ